MVTQAKARLGKKKSGSADLRRMIRKRAGSARLLVGLPEPAHRSSPSTTSKSLMVWKRDHSAHTERSVVIQLLQRQSALPLFFANRGVPGAGSRSEDAPEIPRQVHVELPDAVAQAAGDLEANEIEHRLERDTNARVDSGRLEGEGNDRHAIRDRERKDGRRGMSRKGGLREGSDGRAAGHAAESAE